jgi:hypothetical protein
MRSDGPKLLELVGRSNFEFWKNIYRPTLIENFKITSGTAEKNFRVIYYS